MKRMIIMLLAAMVIQSPASVYAQPCSGGGRFDPESNLLLIGDSFTNDGTWDWAGKVGIDADFSLTYFSEAGRSLEQMDALFGSQYTPGKYDAVVIAGGINDVVRRRSASEIQASIMSIISQTNGEHIIVTTIPPFEGRSSIWSASAQATADHVDLFVTSLAANSSLVSLFDIRSVLDANNDQVIDPNQASSDNFHPQNCRPGKECGMSVIAEAFINQFSSSVFVTGDFNGDGKVNICDIDEYTGNIGSATPVDLNVDQSGFIDSDDVQLFVENFVQTRNGETGTFLGDLNLDGRVDVLRDAFLLVSNLGNPATSYGDGDVNLDGTVTILEDAFVMIRNLGKSNAR